MIKKGNWRLLCPYSCKEITKPSSCHAYFSTFRQDSSNFTALVLLLNQLLEGQVTGMWPTVTQLRATKQMWNSSDVSNYRCRPSAAIMLDVEGEKEHYQSASRTQTHSWVWPQIRATLWRAFFPLVEGKQTTHFNILQHLWFRNSAVIMEWQGAERTDGCPTAFSFALLASLPLFYYFKSQQILNTLVIKFILLLKKNNYLTLQC